MNIFLFLSASVFLCQAFLRCDRADNENRRETQFCEGAAVSFMRLRTGMTLPGLDRENPSASPINRDCVFQQIAAHSMLGACEPASTLKRNRGCIRWHRQVLRRSTLGGAGAGHRTTSTGMAAVATTSAVWLPSISRLKPLRPWDDMTIRSQPCSLAASIMPSAGRRSAT